MSKDVNGFKKEIDGQEKKYEINVLLNRKEEQLEEVAIFGAGKNGIMMLYLARYKGVKVIAFMDNDSDKQGNIYLNDVKCVDPRYIHDVPIIVTIYNKDVACAVTKQCSDLGYKDIIYLDFNKLDEELKKLPDKNYLEMRYAMYFDGKSLNWENPKTYGEKLQWLKLYNQNPEYITMVDKYEAKKYVAKIIGDEYIIPTIGIYDSVEEIQWDELPEQFVIKCTHDSGSVIVCKDKKKFNVQNATEILSNALKRNFYDVDREWVYRYIRPRVIIEQYIVDEKEEELRDYKFYCFDGYVKALLLATNRLSETEELCFDYFDSNFNHLNWTNHWHPNAKVVPHKPQHFEKMKDIASRLSKSIPHVRVDLYEANGNVYFGELTFFDQGGLLKIHPDDWEIIFGDLIKLPVKTN